MRYDVNIEGRSLTYTQEASGPYVIPGMGGSPSISLFECEGRSFWRWWLRDGQSPREAEHDGVTQSVRVGLIFAIALKEET